MKALLVPSIRVSARVGFETVDEINSRLRGVDFPIELALPWRYAMWCTAMARYDEMVRMLEDCRLTVPSIHATQGKISHTEFLRWGRVTCELAERLGASVVTVHPDRAELRGKANYQELALRHLRSVQRKASVTVSVETFGGRDRVLCPDEIAAKRLPMTLDTSHLDHDREVLAFVERYRQRIPVMHLSARGHGEHHLPIDSFCVGVVRKLSHLGWSGTVVLEYLPWHSYRLRSDMELLRKALARPAGQVAIPPPCSAYRGKPDLWRHDAPSPTV